MKVYYQDPMVTLLQGDVRAALASLLRVKSERANPANLVLLCAPCHRFVHSKNNAEGEFLAMKLEKGGTATSGEG